MSSSGRVAVVTDSTSYLPARMVAEHSVRVVPLHVVIEGRSLVEGWQVGPSEVAHALRQGLSVSTSRTSPQALLDAYEAAAADGAVGVASVHLSGALSGTADAARLAAHDSPIPVTVVDSRSVGMGLGFAVVTAAEASKRGLALDEVAAAATERAANSRAWFVVDTLEHLRRGGRMTAAAAMVGTALAIKPLLKVDDGKITVEEKVRTSSKALARMVDLATEAAGDRRVDVAVHHLDDLARAQEVAGELRERLQCVDVLEVCEVGGVVGAHIGPSAIGVAIAPK